jgi:hypothetical protein
MLKRTLSAGISKRSTACDGKDKNEIILGVQIVSGDEFGEKKGLRGCAVGEGQCRRRGGFRDVCAWYGCG